MPRASQTSAEGLRGWGDAPGGGECDKGRVIEVRVPCKILWMK
jgi:hypothetical protein